MLSREQAQEIFERVRRSASVDEVEVIISGGTHALTRFANNTVTQNVSDETYDISVRVAFDGKTARASTNKFDPESLKRAVQSAEALARVQDPDPDLLPMVNAAQAGALEEPNRHYESTAALSASDRAERVSGMVAVARKHDLTAAGVMASGEHMDAIFNSRGVERYHRQTYAESSITMIAPNSSGWQKANSPDVGAFNPVHLAEIAAEKARASANPKEVAPGKYTVILEPAAVLDLVGFMFWDFGGLALLEQRSFLQNRVGTQLFGENITIFDDAYHPLQAGPTFDGEGVARSRVELVKEGKIQNVVFSRGSAALASRSELAQQLSNIRPTGHGFPLPNEMGEAPMNVVFQPPPSGQARTVDQMIAGTERGILITRLWYIREVEPYEKLLTGMTRDGTFWVENGKVQNGLRNFRFNQSVVELLRNVLEMSEPVRASGEESFDMVVPAMKIKDFHFTEVTRF